MKRAGNDLFFVSQNFQTEIFYIVSVRRKTSTWQRMEEVPETTGRLVTRKDRRYTKKSSILLIAKRMEVIRLKGSL